MVEEVGKEHRSGGMVDEERRDGEGKGMRKGWRGKECGKDGGERRGGRPEEENRRILSMVRRSLWQGRAWDSKFVVANDYGRETYLLAAAAKEGAHSTWYSY